MMPLIHTFSDIARLFQLSRPASRVERRA